MEIFLFFTLRCFVGFLSNFGNANLKNPDRILKWDPDIFAWRPMSEGTVVASEEIILFAYEMKSSSRDPNNEEG